MDLTNDDLKRIERVGVYTRAEERKLVRELRRLRRQVRRMAADHLATVLAKGGAK